MRSPFLKFLNVFVLGLALGLLVLAFNLFTNAQSADTAADAALEPSKCVVYIKQFAAKRQIEFGTFINSHFRSAKPTSQLISVAVERYRLYRNEITKEMEEFLSADRTPFEIADKERTACSVAVEEDFTIMKEILRQHILDNAYAKKSTLLVDKYKTINEKLQKLNFSLGQLYGYFGTFSQKLPCFATRCSKG